MRGPCNNGMLVRSKYLIIIYSPQNYPTKLLSQTQVPNYQVLGTPRVFQVLGTFDKGRQSSSQVPIITWTVFCTQQVSMRYGLAK